VVQDAVLRVIRTVKQVDSEPRFRGWLKLVVQTTAFDLLRNERRRKNREAMSAVTPFSTDADADSLQLDWLAEQISRLDPELVRIIEMRFERSWTLRRIGQTLGISGGAVDGRLRRALRKVELSPDEDPERDGASRRGPDSPAIAETPMVLSPTAQLSQPQERPVEHLKPAVHSASTAAEPPSTKATGMQYSATAEPTMGVPPMAPELTILPSEEQAQPIGETPMILSPASVTVEDTIEDLTLAGLEDEAGAHDDRL
jgi:RNA polymerase sigma factor (sigma-70 family)